MPKIKKIRTKLSKHCLPKVTKSNKVSTDVSVFPVDHYSASSMIKFTTNPILWKIQYINRDKYDTTHNISGVLGQSFHKAVEIFYGGNSDYLPKDGAQAIEYGLKAGMDFMEKYNDGFINFSKTIPTKQKALELVAFLFNSFVKEHNDTGLTTIGVEKEILEQIDVEWRGRKIMLPIKLKGFLDRIVKIDDGKIKVIDHKTCYKFSDPEKIDGKKIIQAIVYYFLTYAETGQEPYSMIYDEYKYSKSDDGKQLRSYEIVYAENELYFDFFFRLYDDMTAALNGHMVYVPNLETMFDNEISIISYIHRLDDNEERAKQMKLAKVDNITDLLKKKIQNAGNMRKFMQTVEQQFVSAKNLNYNNMENHEKIQTKLMEFGMLVQFDSKIDGATVDLYRYNPSIGLKMSKLKGYVEDIEQVTGKSGIRVLAPIPNTSLVGFEVPREDRVFPTLPAFQGFELAIGQTISGETRRFDIRTAPHMLVAGATGSGKSIFLASMVKQLSATGADLKLVDPKRVEFDNAYYEKEDIENMIAGLVETMEEKYKQLQAIGKRDAISAGWTPTFLIIDEYADLVAGDDKQKKTSTVTETKKKGIKITKRETDYGDASIADNIKRLAQKGRAAGIHIILATQRASTKIIDGDIKINFPCKVVFRMSKAVDSKVMIDEPGAEKLLGKGDCLFATESGIERLQSFLC